MSVSLNANDRHRDKMNMNMSMSNPWMCGSAMGMVFCPANYQANGGTGFSLIFKSWVISDSHSYALACFGVFLLGVTRQLIAFFRGRLPALQARIRTRTGKGLLNDADEALVGAPAPLAGAAAIFARYPLLLLAVDTLLYAASMFLAYLNMLVAMAYDAGLLSSLVAGEAGTYFATRATAFALGLGSGASAKVDQGEPCCATE